MQDPARAQLTARIHHRGEHAAIAGRFKAASKGGQAIRNRFLLVSLAPLHHRFELTEARSLVQPPDQTAATEAEGLLAQPSSRCTAVHPAIRAGAMPRP